ncbi:hypothetical protein SK069_08370 [Patulibacter brassicae]|uniref:Uncharacterized protein n=2 Tax=Patulibacter brassicae TaxID=1705717 RepID=A0ABU4VID4_9ACTN|nr:hypothetical protein [Patulibacter brassicae]
MVLWPCVLLVVVKLVLLDDAWTWVEVAVIAVALVGQLAWDRYRGPAGDAHEADEERADE